MSKNNPLCRVGTVESVDMETGESVPVEGGGLMMLPPVGSEEWKAWRDGYAYRDMVNDG